LAAKAATKVGPYQYPSRVGQNRTQEFYLRPTDPHRAIWQSGRCPPKQLIQSIETTTDISIMGFPRILDQNPPSRQFLTEEGNLPKEQGVRNERARILQRRAVAFLILVIVLVWSFSPLMAAAD
jgi:hypothetical protein